jgi:hypothetical protein
MVEGRLDLSHAVEHVSGVAWNQGTRLRRHLEDLMYFLFCIIFHFSLVRLLFSGVSGSESVDGQYFRRSVSVNNYVVAKGVDGEPPVRQQIVSFIVIVIEVVHLFFLFLLCNLSITHLLEINREISGREGDVQHGRTTLLRQIQAG